MTDETASVFHIEKKRKRDAIRKENLAFWLNKKFFQELPNLDASVKKNTAFIRKLKLITEEQKATLCKELVSLKLSKYVSEVVSSIVECRLKTSEDIFAAAEICSLLHQRFPEFAELLDKQLRDCVLAVKNEKEPDVSRLRSLLRFYSELHLFGLVGLPLRAQMVEADINSYFTGATVLKILNMILPIDKDIQENISLAVAFLKHYGEDYLGVLPKNKQEPVKLNEENTIQNEKYDSIILDSSKSQFKTFFSTYFKVVKDTLLKQYKKKKKMENYQKEHLITRGELPEEQKNKIEQLFKSFERLFLNAQSLSENLGQELPDFPDDDSRDHVGVSLVRTEDLKSDRDLSSHPVWEDEDSRVFYEDLLDLKTQVPMILLVDKKTAKAMRAEEAKNMEKKNEESGERFSMSGAELDNPEIENDMATEEFEEFDEGSNTDNGEETMNKSEKGETEKKGYNAQLETLLARLPLLMNRDMIDQAAVDFVYLNSASGRIRLTKVLLQPPRGRLDLLPYYSRFIATLNRYISEIGELILKGLEGEFKGLFKKKDQTEILELRIRNMRYLAELTKFQVTPFHIILHCFKKLLDNFSGHNIEVVCCLLETCGRYLFKLPETSQRFSNMLDIMLRKKSALPLDVRYLLMVENAYYQCNPPEKTFVHAPTLTPMEQYITKLLNVDLAKRNVEKIFKLLRKLPWEDISVYTFLLESFTFISSVKDSRIPLYAVLVAGLYRYHPEFSVSVVDNVLEDIRIGLEQNQFKDNQKRISQIKYLGELYNYRMIDSAIIFSTLYTIVTIAHHNGRPSKEYPCTLDAPNDFFRVRLVCTLLDTCGTCFDRGSLRAKLDAFLTFFQMYLFTKIRYPMDVEFMVSDTFELLRPKWKMLGSYDEAVAAVNLILEDNWKSLGDPESVENGPENIGISGGSDDDSENDDETLKDADGNEDGEDSQSDGEQSDLTEEEEVVILTNKRDNLIHPEKNQEDIDAEEGFDREFQKLMTESLESRKFERKTGLLDVPIPMHLLSAGMQEKNLAEKLQREDEGVMFTVLTKKGNKQMSKKMTIPSTSALVVNAITQQEAQREEQQHMKRLVLDYEKREEESQWKQSNGEWLPEGADGNLKRYQRSGKKKHYLMHTGGGGGAAYSRDRFALF